jgi:flagella basal body P-ring formation protein FlgA
MIKTLVILAAAGAMLARADCRKTPEDRIYGADLARADARFSTLPLGLVIGFAPAPGTKRTFTAAELSRIARGNGIAATGFDEICFELRMIPVDPEIALEAMKRSLPRDVTLRIVEFSRPEVPAGPIVFSSEGLEAPAPSSPGTQIWRGSVKYGARMQFSFWARVELSVTASVVVSSKDLPPGAAIRSNSLDSRIVQHHFYGEPPLPNVEEVIGKVPRRLIRAGFPIMRADLIEPPAVRKGDVVTVEVASGPAHVRFEAVAEQAARAGDLVDLRNPGSGRNFKARIEAGGRALIVVPGRFNP